ncbi:MAG TPA: YceI family protein [Gaiellaceae bacterium]|nr:YceI family protein [Gaiellaceae bacterium]
MSATTTSTIAPAGTWSTDPVHSVVGFEVAYLAGIFKGAFRDASATLEVADDGGTTLEGSAQVGSVDVKDENLNAHLQSPDFFDAESHPELLFRAEDLRLEGEELTIEGEIVIKGVTKPVTLTGTIVPPIEDPWGNTRVGMTVAVTVDRTEFGLDWNNPLPTGDPALGNEVAITAELQFVKAA